ncbi:MAG: hypothetical protein HY649_07905 [Acidobacteria bacterium]|nr:hypothetical protein [Acidobacteriota bacterium]
MALRFLAAVLIVEYLLMASLYGAQGDWRRCPRRTCSKNRREAIPRGTEPIAGGRCLRKGRLEGMESPLRQPYKMNWSFNIEREILPNTLFNIGYVGARGVNIYATWADANSPPSIVGANGRRYIPLGTPRLNPTFTQIRFRTTGHSLYYNALQLRMQKRLSRGFQASSSYSWSKTIDTRLTPVRW